MQAWILYDTIYSIEYMYKLLDTVNCHTCKLYWRFFLDANTTSTQVCSIHPVCIRVGRNLCSQNMRIIYSYKQYFHKVSRISLVQLQLIVMGTMLSKEHQHLIHVFFGVMGNPSFITHLFTAIQPVYIRFGKIDAVRIWE